MIPIATRKEIENLEVGDIAYNCFGQKRKVVEVTARMEDIHGKLFALYYVEFGNDGSKMSHSIKEDEPVHIRI